MKTTATYTKQERLEILTDAIETDAIQYYADIVTIKRNEDGLIERVIIHASDDGSDENIREYVITPATIQDGINALLNNDFEIAEEIRQLVLNNDIDSEAADCIIQAALFGKLIYG
jgi:hypothetical protein